MSGTTFPTGPQQASQPPKDNTLKIVLIVLGVIALIAVLLCAGLVGLGIYGVTQVTSVVQTGVAEAIAGEILQTPEAEQALGRVTEMRVKLRDLADPEQAETIPVSVKGTRGSGVLELKMQEGEPVAATLVMEDGQSIELPVPQSVQRIDGGYGEVPAEAEPPEAVAPAGEPEAAPPLEDVESGPPVER